MTLTEEGELCFAQVGTLLFLHGPRSQQNSRTDNTCLNSCFWSQMKDSIFYLLNRKCSKSLLENTKCIELFFVQTENT